MKPYFFIQARLGSSRLPKKVLAPLTADMTLIDCVYKKISKSRDFSPDRTVFLTSESSSDDALVDYFKTNGWQFFRGDENNVFQRFHSACEKYSPAYFFRICADNPFLEPVLMDALTDFAREHSGMDYVSFQDAEGQPVIKSHYGFFAELISGNTFLNVDMSSLNKTAQEHVTPVFYNHPDRYQVALLPIPDKLKDSRIRLTIDTEADLKIAKKIMAHFKSDFNISDVYHFVKLHPDLSAAMQEQIQRNVK